jgi:hypothetical protein
MVTERKKATDKKAQARKKWREEGMVPKEIWVFPEDWPDIKSYIDYKKSLRRNKK